MKYLNVPHIFVNGYAIRKFFISRSNHNKKYFVTTVVICKCFIWTKREYKGSAKELYFV